MAVVVLCCQVLFLGVVVAAVALGNDERRKELREKMSDGYNQTTPNNELKEEDGGKKLDTSIDAVINVPKTNIIDQLRDSTGSDEFPFRRMRRDNGKERANRRKQKSKSDKKSNGTQLNAMQLKVNEEQYINLTVNSSVTKLRHWLPVDWCQDLSSKYFRYDVSIDSIRVLRSGLYYIYAQITYRNSASLNKYEVKVDENSTLFSCTQERRFPVVTSPSPSPVLENCHAGSVTWLRADQTVSIHNSNSFYRPMDLSSQATFWGIMRIGKDR